MKETKKMVFEMVMVFFTIPMAFVTRDNFEMALDMVMEY
jgi:hypothetical protein